MAKKLSDQIKFGQWEHLPANSPERHSMERKYLQQQHRGGESAFSHITDTLGSFGHTLSHPFSTTHGIPTGYGFPLAMLATGGGATGLEAGVGAASTLGRAKGLAALAGLGGLAEAAGARVDAKKKADAAKKKPGSPSSSTPAASPSSSVTPPIAPSIMPLFMQQIMQPYLNSIQQQIAGTAQQYGQNMNSMLSGPNQVALDPRIHQALSAMIPGQQAAMNLMGQSGAFGTVAGASMDQLSQQIQETGAAQRAAQGLYEKQIGTLSAPALFGGTGAIAPSIGGVTAPTIGSQFLNPGMGAGVSPMTQQLLNSKRIANAGG